MAVQAYDWYGDHRVLVVDVGLACCALEFEAAAAAHVRPRVDLLPDASPHPAVPSISERSAGDHRAPDDLRGWGTAVVVVSGTVPDALVGVVLGAVDAVRTGTGLEPVVVAYGACASSGGPYWDSYAVADGIGQFVPVAAYVPGCPPPPEALAEVVDGLAGPTSAATAPGPMAPGPMAPGHMAPGQR